MVLTLARLFSLRSEWVRWGAWEDEGTAENMLFMHKKSHNQAHEFTQQILVILISKLSVFQSTE